MKCVNNTKGLSTVREVRKFLSELGITTAQSQVIHREKDTHTIYFSITLEIPESIYNVLVLQLQKLQVKNICAIKLPEYCKHFLLKFESPVYICSDF